MRHLLELLDGDLSEVYAEHFVDYRPRYTPVLRALAAEDAVTIKHIAAAASISHSAAGQTVTQMRANGLVHLQKGDDGPERLISATDKASALLPQLEKRWKATANAALELEAELSCPLDALLAEAVEALQRRPFRKRLLSQMAEETASSRPV